MVHGFKRRLKAVKLYANRTGGPSVNPTRDTEYADEAGETSGLKIIKTIHGPRVLGDIEAGNREGDSARGCNEFDGTAKRQRTELKRVSMEAARDFVRLPVHRRRFRSLAYSALLAHG